MKLVLDELELVLEHQGQLRSYGTQVIKSGVLNSALEIELNRLIDTLEQDQQHLDVVLGPLFRGKRSDRKDDADSGGAIGQKNRAETLAEGAQQLQLQIRRSSDILDEKLMMADTLDGSWQAFYALTSAGNQSVYAFLEQVVARIELRLVERHQGQNRQFMMLFIGALMILVISSYLMAGFVLQIRQSIAAILSSAHKVAQGDLTVQITMDNRDELGQLAGEFNVMIGKIHGLLEEVRMTTDLVSSQAGQVSGIAAQSSRAVEQQQTETDQVASAITEMVASVQQVARGTQQGADQSVRVSDQITRGQALVEETLTDVTRLSQDIDHSMQVINRLVTDSDSISQVLDVIKGVAEQTNLLALNAAIEAARAGEKGRGFAVVADEVRTLALRTQESTLDIEQMISRLQSGVGDAVRAMKVSHDNVGQTVDKSAQVGQALAEITEAMASISTINGQIARAAEQQSSVADEIGQKVVVISSTGNQTAAGTQDTVAACETMRGQTGSLETVVATFKV